ncbi:MAG: sodium:proton antiporter [Colwelliaceae bacterium]|nr:sodium:proton antiporter [Colwelliaceae bacterium]
MYQALFAIGALLFPVIYGLVFRPLFFGQTPLPLELVFLCASILAMVQLSFLKFSWHDIQYSVSDKISKAIPTLLLLFAIGLLVGSWIISGTIPMLVAYGLKLIRPDYIFIFAFIVPIFFSLCTGTSWGSIATIGLVIITVANVINADLAIVTGAIVGGAYFGDKLSPLSDTTNIAAISVEIDVYEHIQSMFYSTLPAALLAGGAFLILGFIYPPQIQVNDLGVIQSTLNSIETLFHFNVLLLLPPVIIFYGSFKRMSPLPVLIVSTFSACCLSFLIQDYSFDNIIQTLYKGFDVNMARLNSPDALPESIATLFNRGGLYALSEPIIITLLVFIYVGIIDQIQAMPTLINSLFRGIKKTSTLIASSLVASGLTNAMTSSQYANSFIVGEAFAKKYDEFNVPRKVLSRSLEDTGTMLESLIPWSTTAVFVYATLGVSVLDYWHWQLLSLINILLAFIFAFTGFGCFHKSIKIKPKVD